MDKSKKLDRRVLRTRKLLREALVLLIQEKGFDAITVQDITDRADINRATFYLHYADKHDLMLQTMHEVLDELTILPSPYPPMEPGKPDPERLHLFFVKIFEHVAQNAEFYRVMLSEGSLANFAMRIQDYVEQIGLRWFSRADVQQFTIPVEVIMSMVSGAFIGLIKWWLKANLRYTPEDIAEQFMQLILPGIITATGQALE